MRNRFEIAPQAMLVSAGVIMSVVLISIMVSQFERAKALSSAVSERMIETTAQIADSDILQYDGATVTGADVRSFYRRCFSAVEPRSQFVNINNGNAVFKYDGPGHYADITDPEGRAFIRPDDLYKCSVTINKNGIVTDVTFTKK